VNKKNDYKALYLTTEPAHPFKNDVKEAERVILEELHHQITDSLPEERVAIEYLEEALKKEVTLSSISLFLRFWAQKSKKPVAIFFDEFDGLTGDFLLSLLKQFRAGYTRRPKNFPQTICFIGVRDLSDYKIQSKEEQNLGVLYSSFNIKAESLLLPDFSLQDIKALYGQHTEETGQIFSEEALEYAYKQTQGQPWLVNALAYQACFRDVQNRSETITLEVMQKARDALIKRCDTHIDALLERLYDPRVRNFIDSMLSGEGDSKDFSPDDLQYVRDLGLVSRKDIHIANPIYQEIIPRALAYTKQESLNQEISWYQRSDQSLDMKALLTAFTEFYRENSAVWLERFAYKEAGPHLLLLAFLQRIINGGGTIQREYALGNKRVDLFITWKKQRFVLELKVKRSEADIKKGLKQTAEYMDHCQVTEGYLVVFDRSEGKSWEEKIFQRTEQESGKTIEVFGL
jgi:hypothetical protein